MSEKPLVKGELPEEEEVLKKEKGNGLGFHVLKFSEADNLDETIIGDSRLLQNGNETDLVKLAEAGIRKKSILMLQVVLWVTLATDLLGLWLQYITAKIAPSALLPFFLKRIVFQFLINFIIYAAVLYATEYRKYKSSVKNGIVAVAVCTMAGSIGVFHSHSPAFWIASGIGLMFSSIFRDRKLLRNCFVYCVVLTALAALFAIGEFTKNTEAVLECLRNLAISELLIVVIYLVSRTMLIYQTEIMNMTEDFFRMQKEYRHKSEVDNLTGVYSRYYFITEGNELLNVCSSSNPVSVCMLDIDDFKKVNDTYGHDNGDVVLKQLGQLLQNLMNDAGAERVTAGRFGGEEFVVLFSGGNPVNHHKMTEELRRQFSELQFSFMKEHISVSGGIVTCVSKQDDLMKVLKVADDALYASKHNGKNRITVGRI